MRNKKYTTFQRTTSNKTNETVKQLSPITINKVIPFAYTHFYEKLPHNTNNIVRNDSGDIIDVQTITTEIEKHKVIYNGLTTIVILQDGTKGVSKCSPEDTYDKNKGYEIASHRAKIKQLQNRVDKLIM